MLPNPQPRPPMPREAPGSTPAPLHPAVAAAARGELPQWAVATARRRAHMARVATLLDTWAGARRHPDDDRARWRAAGYLHDALRDERPEALRRALPPDIASVSEAVLHGPAAAARLRSEGVDDDELLEAIACHTLGRPGLRTLGRALYVADYVEPGRAYATEWHARVRERAPADLEGAFREVARERVRRGRDSGRALAQETLAMLRELDAEGA